MKKKKGLLFKIENQSANANHTEDDDTNIKLSLRSLNAKIVAEYQPALRQPAKTTSCSLVSLKKNKCKTTLEPGDQSQTPEEGLFASRF